MLVSSDAHGVVDGSATRDLPDDVWVTWETGNPGIADLAASIVAHAGEQGLPTPHQLPVDTTDHSRQLVLRHDEVTAFLLDAVRSCA
ncbi:MAG: hypothetical protein R2731_11130 [Nocardioides sp.]